MTNQTTYLAVIAIVYSIIIIVTIAIAVWIVSTINVTHDVWIAKQKWKKKKKKEPKANINRQAFYTQWFYNWIIVISNIYYSFETRAASFIGW